LHCNVYGGEKTKKRKTRERERDVTARHRDEQQLEPASVKRGALFLSHYISDELALCSGWGFNEPPF
jgi:hypothetical protein